MTAAVPGLWRAAALAAVCLGLALRTIGWNRDVVDFVLPEHGDAATHFYRFHPDEESVVIGALRYSDPFDPPFTMYGTLPLWGLRAALALTGGSEDPETPYRVGRVLSAAFSIGCLAATWFLGMRAGGAATGALAVLLLAVAPLAMQQARFYTVDSLFALLCTVALLAILHTARQRSLPAILMAGAAVGLAASVRLNGAALGAILLLALWLREGSLRRVLGQLQTWAGALAALAAFLGLQPFVLTSPQVYWEPRHALDLGQILRVVGGADLQLYTLQYLPTTFLYPWTDLLPSSTGLAVALASMAGVVLALARRDRAQVLLVSWLVLYLCMVGAALVKPVRYLLPVLPVLVILAADLCLWLWVRSGRRTRWLGRGLAALVLLHGCVYGLAHLRVWTTEDTRVQAGRWIAAHVPPGEALVIENGAFSLRHVVSRQRHRVRSLSLSTLFEARGHLPCGATAEWLARDIGAAPWIALADVNRAVHMRAAPHILPVVASFYDHLLDDRLGYRTVERFTVTPSAAGLSFSDPDAENTWVGFDRPAVRVLRRQAGADQAWRAWRMSLEEEPLCADAALRAGAAALGTGEASAAEAHFLEAADAPTSGALAEYLAAVARSRAGAPPLGVTLELNELTAVGAVHLGLVREGLEIVHRLGARPTADPCLRARRFLAVAAALRAHVEVQAARRVEAVAAVLCEDL